MGFEPMIRVLQTLALPLGDVAMSLEHFGWQSWPALNHFMPAVFCANQSGRWDSNPRPSPWQGDVLPLYYARNSADLLTEGVPRDRIELTTPRFSVACSTN